MAVSLQGPLTSDDLNVMGNVCHVSPKEVLNSSRPRSEPHYAYVVWYFIVWKLWLNGYYVRSNGTQAEGGVLKWERQDISVGTFLQVQRSAGQNCLRLLHSRIYTLNYVWCVLSYHYTTTPKLNNAGSPKTFSWTPVDLCTTRAVQIMAFLVLSTRI